MDSAQNEDITKQLSFGRQHLDGSSERKTIYPLAEADLARYRLLGVGSARSPSLAIFMGFRHCPGFYERVVAYRLARGRQAQILEDASGDSYGSIEFFEERGSDAGQDKGWDTATFRHHHCHHRRFRESGRAHDLELG